MGTTKRRRDNRTNRVRQPLLSVRIESSRLDEIKRAAAEAGTTKSDWVRQAIDVRLNGDSLLTEVNN